MTEPLTLLALLKRRAGWLLAGVALIIVSLVAGMTLLAVSGWFITASALAGLGLLIGLEIFTPGATIRLAAVGRTVSRYLERLITHEATFRLLSDLRQSLLRSLLQLDERQLQGLRRGDTLSQLTGDVDALDHLFLGVIGPSAAALMITLILALALALLVSPSLALMVLALLMLNPLLAEFTRRRGLADSQALVQALPELRRQGIEMLEGIADLTAFDRLSAARQRWLQCSERAIGVHTRLSRLDASAQAGITALGFIGVWSGLVIGIGLYTDSHISGPVLGLLVLALLGLGDVWQPLPGAWRKLEQCRGAYQRIRQLTDRQPELNVAEPAIRDLPRQAPLVIDRISHRYDTAIGQPTPWVLRDFSLTLAVGERLVVTGPSGCGKTTLAQLIMRLMDPVCGRILFGEHNIRHIDPSVWRQQIAVLSQHSVLFRDTLANNLRLAQPHASDEALIQALHQAGLSALLQTLPDGLDTWIDEAGSNVSGGESRRLALARLMLTDAPMVILDEPMTGLDAHTARALSATLEPWLGKRSVLMISHDPSLLPRCDRLIALTAASAHQ